MVAGHDPAFFHRVVEQRKRSCRTRRTGVLQSHLGQDMGHGIAPRRSRRKAQVDDPERDVQPLARFLGHQLPDAGNLEGSALDCFSHDVERRAFYMLQCHFHDTGPGNADVDRAFRLPDAAERAGHERIVLHRVRENDKFGAAQAVLVCRQFRRSFDDFAHFLHGVHVDSGPCGSHVDAGAKEFRLAQHLRDRSQQAFVRQGSAFVHQRRIPAEEIDADFRRRPVKRQCDRTGVVLADQADRRHADPFVHDRDSEFRLDLFAGLHKIAGSPADLFIYAFRASVCVPVRTVQQVNPQRDRADIEVFLLDHVHRLEDLSCFNHWAGLLQIRCIASKISIRCI